MTVLSAQNTQNGRRFGETAHADCVRRRIMLESAKKKPQPPPTIKHSLHFEAKVPNPAFRQLVVLAEEGAT